MNTGKKWCGERAWQEQKGPRVEAAVGHGTGQVDKEGSSDTVRGTEYPSRNVRGKARSP